ncbi:hypothetical protein DL96DRAFT_1554404 [Flagelloscypha sp. PMI_526]|nr:hypothetical protein DL96DRAFT_1554404 [Flagelloscypha sp. PMI_526]
MSLDDIFKPSTLPVSKRVVPNRLVKISLYEHLAKFSGGPPNRHHFALYSQWAQHPWGMIFTGNTQVSGTHLTLGRDLLVPTEVTEESAKPWSELADIMKQQNGLALMQLSHGGRQSSILIGGRPLTQPPLAPSAVGVAPKHLGRINKIVNRIVFPTPKEMSLEDIDQVVQDFTRGAELAFKAGFDGIELHAAHGYMLSQWLSPKANCRTDEYSCNPTSNALRLLQRIATSIRAATPSSFVLGIKLNASDYITAKDSAEEEEIELQQARAREHISAIASWEMFDFIEVSGGDYQRIEFMSNRQATFAALSESVLNTLTTQFASSPEKRPLVLLTGGLTSPSTLHSVKADLLGLGRAAILTPDLPTLLRAAPADPNSAKFTRNFTRIPELSNPLPFDIPLVGAGVATAWYTLSMRELAACWDEKRIYWPPYHLGPIAAVVEMWLWNVEKGSFKVRAIWVHAVTAVVVALTAYWYYMLWF